MESAVIVRVSMPEPLERLRLRCVRDAALGVPAHVTLLYPFVEVPALTADTRRIVEDVASAHRAFAFALSGPFRWPDTVYAAVDPEDRFLAIHRDLTSAFPAYPIYGQPGFELTAHVTIAEGDHVRDPATLEAGAWSSLPVTRTVEALELIAQREDGRWAIDWTVPLAGPAL